MASDLSGRGGPAAELQRAAGTKTILVGFMGAGKTTAARSLGGLDVDEVIEARLGRRVADVFAAEGEAAFRETEEAVTLELLDRPDVQVLALGGGAVGSGKVRRALRRHRVVWLETVDDLAWRRVEASGNARPLAQDLLRFCELHAERTPIYEALADVIVPAERSRELAPVLAALDGLPARDTKVLWATSPSGDYPVYIGPGLVTRDRFWPTGVDGRRVLITDHNAGRRYGEMLEPLLGSVRIMPGEQSKTVAHAEIVWTEMVRHGATRGDLVAALGGGVVGDLAGFCAATYQRGMRWVGIPTTLLAQVDSSLGGKTGVDLAEAKNYVGAFHQPSAVISDTDTLRTLPPEELAAGYAEVVKTGLIAGGALWDRLRAGAEPGSPEVVARCAHTKLRIVAQDPHDRGLRQLLNLGHTVAHAIETATGYARYRHGEAVGLGLLAELRLSGADALRAEVLEMLAVAGLPTVLTDTEVDEVAWATRRDKKRVGEGPVPFVLCQRPGAPVLGQTVPDGELRAAIRELMA